MPKAFILSRPLRFSLCSALLCSALLCFFSFPVSLQDKPLIL
jgi:hypothetical protein